MITSSPHISIVVPVFAEAPNLHNLVEQIKKNVDLISETYEIIFVDDGSNDESWDVIKKITTVMPEIKAVRFSRNFGKEYALFAGLKEAKGDVVITIDSDMQHPPELIPVLYEMWKSQAAEVIDVIKKERQHESLFNRIAAKLFYLTFDKLSGLDVSNSTDYKLLDRKVVDSLIQFQETHLFYRGLLVWMGFKHVNIKIEVNDRTRGVSKWGFTKLAKYALNNIFNYSSKPLVLIGLFGLLFIISATILMFISLIRLMTGTTLGGFPTVIILQLFIGGIIIFSITLIGAYIAKIYDEVKSRPKYIIKERLDGE
ncbi:MAG: glycosyltransferase [Nitrosopumilales archaeon]|nr:MAG: glycosyltransferase [Nitrosopumilales archaeon]